MKKLEGIELEQAIFYIKLAAEEAKKSKCKKSQRGATLVQGREIIGAGNNEVTLPELCNPCIREDIRDNSHIELCSAVHAEQMVLLQAKGSLEGSVMYHVKLKDGKMVPSGKPSCTVCSRMLHKAGVSLVLWHEEGYFIYSPEELNRLSFEYVLGRK